MPLSLFSPAGDRGRGWKAWSNAGCHAHRHGCGEHAHRHPYLWAWHPSETPLPPSPQPSPPEAGGEREEGPPIFPERDRIVGASALSSRPAGCGGGSLHLPRRAADSVRVARGTLHRRALLGPGAHRNRLVARRRHSPRLLFGGNCRRRALLALPHVAGGTVVFTWSVWLRRTPPLRAGVWGGSHSNTPALTGGVRPE